MKKYFLKLLLLLSGNIFAAFGVFLCSISQKGVDPITVLLGGIMNTLNVPIGLASILFHTSLIIICFAIDKKSIKLGTIIAVLTFSSSLNLFISKFATLGFFANPPSSWIFLMFGIIFMGVGFSVAMFANIGYNTADVALKILSAKTKFSIKTCKSLIDLCCATLGIILGGQIGVGTICCVLFVGVIYSTTLKILQTTSHSNEKIKNYVLINEN